MSYQIAWESNGVVVTVTDTLAGRDLCGFVEKICEDIRFDALRYCIVDLSCVERVTVDDEHVITSAASLIGAAFSNARVVVTVVSMRAAVHALCGSLCETRAMPFLPAVFPDQRMARRWLQTEIAYRQSDAATPEMQFRPQRDCASW